MLIKHNQNQFGVIAGARRLDECMRLISSSFENSQTFRMMLSFQFKTYQSILNCPSFSRFF
jgi:hypothetical protein